MARPHSIAVALALALAGCADSAPFRVIQSGLAEMKGKPVKLLVAKIGEPDSKDTADTGHVYIWDGSNNLHPTFWTNFVNCSVKVYVDKTDTITGFFHSGSDGACVQYAHKLDHGF